MPKGTLEWAFSPNTRPSLLDSHQLKNLSYIPASMPSVARGDRKQFQYLPIVFNNKTRSLVLEFNWCEDTLKLFIKLPKSVIMPQILHQTVCDPPQISLRVFEIFQSKQKQKINHMGRNHRHKIRSQDFVYLKFNK